MKHFITLILALLSVIILSVFVSSCQKEQIGTNFRNSSQSSETKSSLDTLLVYNTTLGRWMIKQENPDIICSDTPTYYAIKLFPKTESELNELIRTPDIVISYIPFNYNTLTEAEELVLSSSKPSSYCVYQEDIKYYEDYGEALLALPVLYISWPASKPLPDGFDYTIEYSATIGCDDNYSQTRSTVLNGRIMDFDSLLNRYVPVKNLRMRLSYGLSNLETYTDSEGYFSFSGNINENATLKMVYENNQWRITDNSLFSYVESLGKVVDIWGAHTNAIITLSMDSVMNAIHRGAQHFFNGNHAIVTPASNYSLRLNVYTNYDGNGGAFIPLGLPLTPYINLYYHPINYDAGLISNTIHELGHFNLFQKNGGYNNYVNVNSLIKESYADYISSYLRRDYYTSNNSGVNDPNWSFPPRYENQDWNNNILTVEYSPLFIDLRDDFNQGDTHWGDYVFDVISGVSHSMIQSIVTGKQDWASLRSALSVIVPNYCTLQQFNVFTEKYDEYFN